METFEFIDFGSQSLSYFILSEFEKHSHLKISFLSWLVWLSGLTAGLWTKGSPVQFPTSARARVAGQVPSRGCVKGNHTSMFLSLPFSLPSPI